MDENIGIAKEWLLLIALCLAVLLVASLLSSRHPTEEAECEQANARLAEAIADTVRAANDSSVVSKLALNIGRNQVRTAELLIEYGECKKALDILNGLPAVPKKRPH